MRDPLGIERMGAADDAAGGTSRPVSKAVRADDSIYVSSQVPADGGEIISGGIVPQAESNSGSLWHP